MMPIQALRLRANNPAQLEARAAALCYWDMDETDTTATSQPRLNRVGDGRWHQREVDLTGSAILVGSVGASTGTGLRGSGNAARTTTSAGLANRTSGSPITGTTQSYTICGWFKPTTATFPQTVFRIAQDGTAAGTAVQAWIAIDDAGTPGSPYRLFFAPTQVGAGYTVVASDEQVVSGNWIFVAVQRNHSNNTARIRVNGGAWQSASTSVANQVSSLHLSFGFSAINVAVRDKLAEDLQYWGIFNGVLSDAAVDYLYNSGSGRTASEIGLTTTYTDPYWEFDQALLHFDGADTSTTFTDATGRTWTANGNAQLDTAQQKFGSASGLFDGTGDYITTPDDAEISLTELRAFTAEAWIRLDTIGVVSTIYGKRTAAGGANELTFQVANTNLLVALVLNGSGNVALAASTTALTTGVWYHVEMGYDGEKVYVFLDGVLEGTSATQTATPTGNNVALHIGRDSSNTGRDMHGHIDEARFTAWVCRHKATFTPPAAPFVLS